MAEAFQLPLAEATAVGLPVIAPMGGAAEEVLDPQSAVFVPSIIVPRANGHGWLVHVDDDALTAAMENVWENTSAAAAQAPFTGPSWAAQHLSIKGAADALLSEIMERSEL